jgi:virulence-associated protein VagC
MSTVITAKVFTSGSSHALQLPRAFKIKDGVLHLTRSETGFEAQVPPSKSSRARRLKLLRALSRNHSD